MAGVGRSLGAAVTGNRPLESFEVVPVLGGAIVLAGAATIALALPRLVAWLLAAGAIWMTVTLVAEAWSLRRRK